MSDELTLADEIDVFIKHGTSAIFGHEDAKKIASALRSFAAAQEQKAVGYRYRLVLRNGAKLDWNYSDTGVVGHDGCEVESLYTAPQNPQPAPGWDDVIQWLEGIASNDGNVDQAAARRAVDILKAGRVLRNTAPSGAEKPDREPGDCHPVLAHADELHDLGFQAGWEAASRSAVTQDLAGAGGVRVKKLEWCDQGAETSFGSYTASVDGDDLWRFTFHRYPYGEASEEGWGREEHAKAAAQADYEQRIRSALDQPLAVENDPLENLVSRFSDALLKKLKLAQANGRSGWEKDDWEVDCQRGLMRHVQKGAPRDVAAYCAFMWHHGWITAKPLAADSNASAEARLKIRITELQGSLAAATKAYEAAVKVRADTRDTEALLMGALDRIPTQLFWLIGKGRMSADEPLYGVEIKDGCETIAEGEHDDLASAINLACDELTKLPCTYCANKYTGLPGSACENCMNTGSAWPEALSAHPDASDCEKESAAQYRKAVDDANRMSDKGEVHGESAPEGLQKAIDDTRTAMDDELSNLPKLICPSEPRGCPTPGACSCTVAKDWMRQIINAGGSESVAQQAVALAALNGLFDRPEDRVGDVMEEDLAGWLCNNGRLLVQAVTGPASAASCGPLSRALLDAHTVRRR